MYIIALLVGRSHSFSCLHLYWVWSLLVHPTPKNQVCHCVHYKFLCMVFVSHSKVNFHVLPFKNLQNTSRFVTLFSAHGDVVVGFAIFHIAYSKKKEKKKERKKALLQRMWMLVGTRWNRLAMVCERKRWGRVPSFIKRARSANLSLKNLLYFCMEDSKNPIASRWQRQPPLKINFYLCFTNEKL